MAKIDLPVGPVQLIQRLEQAGFEAYAVGGCVRDALLGQTPHDWDICTSARPEEMAGCFRPLPVIETGLKHGTLTVILAGEAYEVTTYRVDGPYTDHRRPDTVQFVSSLRDDLARRDFTVNAMAAGIDGAVTDPYGGQSDLSAQLIRCVGEPDLRFGEDALRILRALRFASVYQFALEQTTAESIHRNRELLKNVAPERIHMELNRLLLGSGVRSVLEAFHDVLAAVIPELGPLAGWEQHNRWHLLDVWAHTALSVACAGSDLSVRLALLFHDVAKPETFSSDPEGNGHFFGHAQRGAELTGEILTRLKYDNETRRAVTQLINYHDAPIEPEDRSIKRWLNRIGESQFRRLLQVKRADRMAQNLALSAERLAVLDELEARTNRIISERQCFSLRDLSINGRDLLSIGIPAGPYLGSILNQMVERVIAGELPNKKETLLAEVCKNERKRGPATEKEENSSSKP